MGGERGCAAALSNFRFAVERAAVSEDGESRKMRKPKERTPASIIVMGFVRRSDLVNAMAHGAKIEGLEIASNWGGCPLGPLQSIGGRQKV